MKKFLTFSLVCSAMFFIVAPFVVAGTALAVSEDLVKCGGPNDKLHPIENGNEVATQCFYPLKFEVKEETASGSDLKRKVAKNALVNNTPLVKHCETTHLLSLLHRIIDIAIFTAAPLLVVLLISIGGIMIMISQGDKDPASRSNGKRLIQYALIGYVIILSAWLIVNSLLTVIGVAEWTDLRTQWNVIWETEQTIPQQVEDTGNTFQIQEIRNGVATNNTITVRANEVKVENALIIQQTDSSKRTTIQATDVYYKDVNDNGEIDERDLFYVKGNCAEAGEATTSSLGTVGVQWSITPARCTVENSASKNCGEEFSNTVIPAACNDNGQNLPNADQSACNNAALVATRNKVCPTIGTGSCTGDEVCSELQCVDPLDLIGDKVPSQEGDGAVDPYRTSCGITYNPDNNDLDDFRNDGADNDFKHTEGPCTRTSGKEIPEEELPEWIAPVRGFGVNKKFVSVFGGSSCGDSRRCQNAEKLGCHRGIDFKGVCGTNIQAVADGKVYDCLTSVGGDTFIDNGKTFGMYVAIKHTYQDTPYYAYYTHLDSIEESIKNSCNAIAQARAQNRGPDAIDRLGIIIAQGALIGRMGNTGTPAERYQGGRGCGNVCRDDERQDNGACPGDEHSQRCIPNCYDYAHLHFEVYTSERPSDDQDCLGVVCIRDKLVDPSRFFTVEDTITQTQAFELSDRINKVRGRCSLASW